MKKRNILSILLVVLIFCVSVSPANAASTQQKILDANNKKASTESKLEEQQDKINELHTKKGELESQLKQLNYQLETLTTSIKELQKEAQQKQANLEQIKGSLARAKDLEDSQYESMKSRIQYMYETNNVSYLGVLLESESFSDFLNKADTIAQITKYDRQMLEEYIGIREVIVEQEKQAIQDKETVEKLQQELKTKQEDVEAVMAETDSKIASYMGQITDAKSVAASYMNEIAKQKENLTALMEKSKQEKELKAREEAAVKKAQEEARVAEIAKEQAKKEEAKDNIKPNVTGDVTTKPDSSSGAQGDKDGDGSGSYLGRFKLTSYCWCAKCNGRAGKPTASGTTPTVGRTVAMSGVPFGTKLRINGHIYTVEDRGTSYGHVDIFQGSHQDALSFGLQYADVYKVN